MIIHEDPLFRRYDPLQIHVDIRPKSGTIKQVHYEETDTYVPNRRLTPLYLQPSFYVVDPNSVIIRGEKINQLSSGKWYLGAVTPDNLITRKTTDPGSETAEYAVGTNYELVVRKNTPYTSPQMLYFVGTFYDTRRSMDVYGQKNILLSSTSNAENESLPVLVLDYPESHRFNPLQGTGQRTITASMFKNGEKVSPENMACWWYMVENGKQIMFSPLDEQPMYVSGQNTHTLTLDTEYIGNLLIRCVAVYYTGNKPGTTGSNPSVAETKFIRRLPANLTFQINQISGKYVMPNTYVIKREAEVYTADGQKVTNPGRHWLFKWLHNWNTPGSTDREIAHGAYLELPRNYAGASSAKPTLLKLDVVENTESHLFYVGDDYLTDSSGHVLTGY